jgi:hypothetical protein
MSTQVTPSEAAKLASDVYSVSENIATYKLFLQDPLFAKNAHSTLTAKVGGRFFLSAKDGFGVCIKGAGNYKNDIFLIFRGTTTANNKADFLTDANIGLTRSATGDLVHVGFNATFNSMLPQISAFLAKNQISGTVHCIGHSLGGAVASLTADWLKKTMAKSVKLYTFGAPRVGTAFFSKSTTKHLKVENMHRVYHATDPVPMVALFPFMQAPYNNNSHYIASSELVFSGAAHKMKQYRRSVKSKSWHALNGVPDQPYHVEYAIEQWLESKFYSSANSSTFLRWAESALIYVLKKIGMSAIVALQGAAMGVSTLADKLAYILYKGIDLASHISYWVIRFARKIMQALGMKVPKEEKDFTQAMIRTALLRLTRNAYESAKLAVVNMT